MADAKWEFPMDPSEVNKDLEKKAKGLTQSLTNLDKIAKGEEKMNKIVMDIVAKRAQRKQIMDRVRRAEGIQNFSLQGDPFTTALGRPRYDVGSFNGGGGGGPLGGGVGAGGGGGDVGGIMGQARMLSRALGLITAAAAPTAAAFALMSSIANGANAQRIDAYKDVGKLNMKANYWASATGMDRNAMIGMVSSSVDPQGVSQVFDAAARMRMTGVANLTPQKLNMLVNAVNNGMPASEAVTMLQQGTTFRAARVQPTTGEDAGFKRSEQMQNIVKRTAGEEIYHNQLPQVQRALAVGMSWEEAKATHPEWANVPGIESLFKLGASYLPSSAVPRNMKRLQGVDELGEQLPEFGGAPGPATPVRQPSINTSTSGRGNSAPDMRAMAAAAAEAVRNQKQVDPRTGNRPAGD